MRGIFYDHPDDAVASSNYWQEEEGEVLPEFFEGRGIELFKGNGTKPQNHQMDDVAGTIKTPPIYSVITEQFKSHFICIMYQVAENLLGRGGISVTTPSNRS
jgi:hypothetical protein